MTYTNRTGAIASFINCNGRLGQQFQKFVNGNWKTVLTPPVLACLGAPIIVFPGETYHGSLYLAAGPLGSNDEPAFSIRDISGVYRVVWTGLTTDSASRPQFAPFPLEHRVSNQFVLIVAPGSRD